MSGPPLGPSAKVRHGLLRKSRFTIERRNGLRRPVSTERSILEIMKCRTSATCFFLTACAAFGQAIGMAHAQSTAPAPRPEFEVASVKPCRDTDTFNGGSSSPGRFTISCLPVMTLISMAYIEFGSGRRVSIFDDCDRRSTSVDRNVRVCFELVCRGRQGSGCRKRGDHARSDDAGTAGRPLQTKGPPVRPEMCGFMRNSQQGRREAKTFRWQLHSTRLHEGPSAGRRWSKASARLQPDAGRSKNDDGSARNQYGRVCRHARIGPRKTRHYQTVRLLTEPGSPVAFRFPSGIFIQRQPGRG